MQTTFLGIQAPYETAAVVLLPAPYDGTTTYMPGARFGPRAILEASHQIEFYDREFDADIAAQVGIHTLDAIPTWDSTERMLIEARQGVQTILEAGKTPFLLGGDHSLTLGAVQAAVVDYPDLVVVQLDAHADLRDTYNGSRLNHACVGRRTNELVPILQAGIRSLCEEEVEWARSHETCTTGVMESLDDPDWWPRQVEGLRGRPVYLTLDVDVLDPSVMPATGTPEPGGLSWIALVGMIRTLAAATRIIGADCMELMPIPGIHAPSYAAAKLVYKTITFMTRTR